MIHAYDKNYLVVAQRNLGRMLEYLVIDCKYSIEEAWSLFLNSAQSVYFEKGDCNTVVGMSGVELAKNVLQQVLDDYYPIKSPSYSYDRSPEYWAGWAVAYYQWITGLKFIDIQQAVPISQIFMMYTPYHEMDIRQFVDRMNELYHEIIPETNLKMLRGLAGMSQSELAMQSGVPVRTIQQYEQRQKNINKAQGETLLRLARTLSCNMEDIMEKVS